MADVVISVKTDAERAARDFAALDRTVDRLGSSALSAGDRFQSFFSRVARGAAEARREVDGLTAAQARAAAQPRDALGRFTTASSSSSFGSSAFVTGGIGSVGGAAIGIGIGLAATGAREIINQQLELSRAQLALGASAREAGTSLDAQRQAAARLADQLNINIVAASQLTAQSTRLAVVAGLDPQSGNRISQALADSLVAGGRSLDELPDRLRQLSTGQDELFDVLGPVKIGNGYAASPEQIYKLTAAQQGLNRELTDTEKLQARVNAVLLKGQENAGLAADSVRTLAGQWDFFKNDLLKQGSNFFAYLQGGALAGILNEPTAAGIGPAAQRAQYADKLAAGLADIDRFRAGLGTAQFDLVGKQSGGGVVTAGQYQNVAAFQALANQLYLDAATAQSRFAEEQRAALPAQIAAQQARIAQTRGGLLAGANSIFDLDTRRAALQQRTVAGGFKLGYYGQTTDETNFSDVYGETDADRIDRAFALSKQYGDLFGEKRGSAAEGERFGRELLLRGLANVDPSQLSASRRQQYEDALSRAIQDQIENETKQLNELEKQSGALEKLQKRLAPDTDEAAVEKPVIVKIENASDKVAGFAGNGPQSSSPFGSQGTYADGSGFYSNRY